MCASHNDAVCQAGESEDEEMDEAMKLIDQLTNSPRPWQATKDPNKKKIVVSNITHV